MISLFDLVVLLILFQLKHFVADYPLQNKYMLGKFKETGWVAPLAAHCSYHAGFTFLISIFFAPWYVALMLSVVDFVIHFTMDRFKASPNMLGRFKMDNPKFWWALGFDQMVHHITHYLIIVVLLLS